MPIGTPYTIDSVVASMKDQPWGITEAQGRLLHEFVLRERPRAILELGCGIGTSACYMAAALDACGAGKILSIDCNPELPHWVKATFAKLDPALQSFHEVRITATSYNDELMKLIETNTVDGVCNPCFDFCFIDGAHTWEVDSCAFFLSEKLLKPGGWMLFDDLTWTIAGSPEALKRGVGKNAPQDLLKTPQVMKVFELCVSQHPAFDSLTITDDWGWARKKPTAGSNASANAIARLYGDRQSFFGRIRRLAKLFRR